MEKHQGEDIDFSIRFDSSLSEDIQSFDDCDEVQVYVYTNRHKEVKFSDVVRIGHLELLKIDPLFRTGIVPGALTKNLAPGNMSIEVWMMRDGVKVVDKVYETGVELIPTQIRKES